MVEWSKNIKCPVVLGFDVDGISGAINRNPKTAHLPSLMSMSCLLYTSDAADE